MLRNVFVIVALVVAPMLIGFALGERFFDMNEENIFDSDNLMLHLHTEKRALSIQLEEHVLPEAPVFTFRADGGFDQHQASDDQPSVRFFKDTLGRGNFIVHEDASGNRVVKGFMIDGSERVVLKPASAEERRRRDTGNWHVISRREDNLATSNGGDVFLPDPDVMKSYKEALNKPLKPTVRGGNINQTIAMNVFTDFQVWEEQRKSLGSDDPTKIIQAIKLYFTQVIASMSDRYRKSFETDPDLRLTIVPVGFFISQKDGESPWTEGSAVQIPDTPLDNDKRKTARGDIGLDEFRKWLALNQNSIPVKFNYAIYFTGRNIAAPGPGFTVLGIAPLAGICTPQATGASEDFGGFESAGVAAHELAHNLGSDHDGSTSNADAAKCQDADNFMMAPSIRSHLNQLVFSPCSKVQIKKLLATRTCLQNAASADPFVATVGNKYVPGQLYSVQERCKAMYGPNAEPLSYDLIESNNINVCLTISCWTNYQAGQNNGQPIVAPTGTPCGDGKWCVQGQCVADANAPKGTCFMGDVPVSDNSGFWNTCPKAIAPLLSGYGKKTTDELCASLPFFKKNCCRTCKVAGGLDATSGKIAVIMGTALPTSASTTAGATTKAAASTATTAKTSAPATTKAAATTAGTGCLDHAAMMGGCTAYISYCEANAEITVNGVNLGQIKDVCRKSCKKC